ncbi:MAG TPA: VCBS repeat-containing protein, partial [Candidatus Polarisedimenticolaceae bacterium]
MRLGIVFAAGLALAPILPARAAGSLFQGEYFPISTESSPYVADFDGDSAPDLAFAVSAQAVPILRTKADRAVESWGQTHRGRRWLIGAGDFDGNGRGDLAFLGDGALELRSGRGDGTFEDGRLLAFPEPAYYWTLGRSGDVDADGRVDLVFAGEAVDAIHIAFGGDSGFSEIVTLSGVETNSGYLVADLTGGGRASIVVRRFGAVDVYEFAAGREVGPPTSTPMTGDSQLRALVDLNGDGRRDLLLEVTSVPPSRLMVARGMAGASFDEPEDLAGPQGAGCLPITGDWDLDGDVDLGCQGDADEVAFLANDGRGEFTTWRSYALPEGSYGFMDVPGWPEAPILLGQVLNASGVNHGVVVHPAAPAGRSAVPVGMVAPFAGFPERGHFFVEDIDEDGDRDWIAFENAPFFLRNDGGGGPAGPPEPLPTEGFRGTVGDFDGDGRVDLLRPATDGSPRILFEKGNGDATFRSPVEAFVVPQGWYGTPVPLDADEDGRLDVVETSLYGGLNVWRGRGDGTFDGPIVAYPPPAPIDGNVVAGDFDGDGDRDLAGSSAFLGIVLMLRRDDGTYAPPESIRDTAYFSLGVASGDFDGDGDDDLARFSARSFGGSVDLEVLVADGHGGFEVGGRLSTGAVGYRISSADTDSDGRDEIVFGSFGMTAVVSFDGGPGPWPVRRFPAPGEHVLADLDGDGRPDLSSLGFLQYMPWERPDAMGIFALLNLSSPPNAPPVASAGGDQLLECTSFSGATA